MTDGKPYLAVPMTWWGWGFVFVLTQGAILRRFCGELKNYVQINRCDASVRKLNKTIKTPL